MGRSVRSTFAYLGSEAHQSCSLLLELATACWGWAHLAFLAQGQQAQGQRPPLQGLSLHRREAALHCPHYLAVSPRPVPESQNLTKMFSVFSSCMAHMAFAVNTTPKLSKIALNGKLLAGSQNHKLTVFHLILIITITLSAWWSIILSYGWWFLTAAHDFVQNTFCCQERGLFKSNLMALFCGWEMPSQIGRIDWLMRFWWSASQWITD